jgi:hypothetical protein
VLEPRIQRLSGDLNRKEERHPPSPQDQTQEAEEQRRDAEEVHPGRVARGCAWHDNRRRDAGTHPGNADGDGLPAGDTSSYRHDRNVLPCTVAPPRFGESRTVSGPEAVDDGKRAAPGTFITANRTHCGTALCANSDDSGWCIWMADEQIRAVAADSVACVFRADDLGVGVLAEVSVERDVLTVRQRRRAGLRESGG